MEVRSNCMKVGDLHMRKVSLNCVLFNTSAVGGELS